MKIKFENRAVAFIDVLGFKSVVEGAAQNSNENLQQLQSLVDNLTTAIPLANSTTTAPKKFIPKHIYISDSIILSNSLSKFSIEGNKYSGLSILIMRVILLTQILLDKGYLIRGGISVGKVCHKYKNIVGPAYQEAYEIETKTKYPRVELSPEARECCLQEHQILQPSTPMCVHYKDHFMVNGLHESFFGTSIHQNIFDEYRETAKSKINDLNHYKEAQCKWEWFEEFIKWQKKKCCG